MITILATAQGMIMARKFDFSEEKMWERNNIFLSVLCTVYLTVNVCHL